MTSDEDPHAHCARPIYNVYVRSKADAVALRAVDKTVEYLCGMAALAKHKREETDRYYAGAAKAYEDAARILEEKFREALAENGEIHEIRQGTEEEHPEKSP